MKILSIFVAFLENMNFKSNQAAMEHGSRMRHQSKNPEYVAKLGVNNGVKGSGNPYIDQGLSTGNETILVGKQVILRCHIEDVKGKSVRKCNIQGVPR